MENDFLQNLSAWMDGSVVVHPDGSPRVLYHGTNQDIDSFDRLRLGGSTNSVSSILGVWLSDSPLVAGEYADKAARIVVAEVVSHEVRSRQFVEALERAERAGDWNRVNALTEEFEAHELDAIRAEPSGQNIMPVYVRLLNPHVVDLSEKAGHLSTGEAAAFIEEARLMGCDGVIFKGCNDTESLTISDHYVVFDPSAIKSACGNSGRFVVRSSSLSDREPVQARPSFKR